MSGKWRRDVTRLARAFRAEVVDAPRGGHAFIVMPSGVRIPVPSTPTSPENTLKRLREFATKIAAGAQVRF